ncbi:hypothetical protein ETB97_010927 [Aspergillus alliaceus]|uniref:Rhodopsin domain-containing protein n=1 Tax=Petromyces alliaceus TaxID=209559 RepID=A0A8H6E9M8_PETAA|nr:hypothetical protein ETB97_010927 [Aspergillus burnettii]
MCLRCFVRLRIVRAFGKDDATMVVAMFFNLAFAICTFAGAKYGFGQEMNWFVDKPGYLRYALLYWWLGQNFYLVTAIIAKLSIAMTLLRITPNRVHAVILYTVSGLTLLVGAVFVLVSIFECTPVDFFWNRMTKSGKCIDPNALVGVAYLGSAVAAATDFTLGLLPCVIVWNLQMNRRTKIALAGIMGLGCIAGATVVARIPYLSAYKHADFLHATHPVSVCSNIETGVGITASSLATLRPIFRFLRDTKSGSRSRKRPTENSYPLSNVTNGGQRHWASINSGYHATITGRQASMQNVSTESITPLNQGMKIERSFQVDHV